MAHASSDETVGERGVAVGGDLGAPAHGGGRGFETEKNMRQIFCGIGVAGVEGEEGVAHDVLIFAAKALFNQLAEFRYIEVEHAREQAEDVNIFALLFAGAADGFNRRAGHGNPDRGDFFIVGVGGDVIGVVKQHAAGPQGRAVAFITVLVESNENISAIAGRKNFA